MINILVFTKDESLKNQLESLPEGGFSFYFSEESFSIKEIINKNINVVVLDSETISIVEISKKFKKNFILRFLPKIALMRDIKIGDFIEEVDDYIEKSEVGKELFSRIKINLQRSEKKIDLHPLTKLPGNNSILKEIEERLKKKELFSIGYADLDNFKEYNDYYGFSWGDKVVQFTANLISEAVIEVSLEDSFVAHIGGDDFIFIISPYKTDEVCRKIINKFDEGIRRFYKEEDIKKGYIIVKNREGKVTSIPIMSISIGVTSNQSRSFRYPGEVIQVLVEMNKYAKKNPQSNYVVDRRKAPSSS